MMNLNFRVFYDDVQLCSFEYMVIEEAQHHYRFYMFDITYENEIVSRIECDEQILVRAFIANNEQQEKIFFEDEFTLGQAVIFNKDISNIGFICQMNFSVPDYWEYDQQLVDLFYFWNKNESYVSLRKKTYTYTFACGVIAGIQEKPPRNKAVHIDGEKIDTKYELYNVLAELLLGNEGYIGSNLDAFEECLEEGNMTADCNNKISISSYDLLCYKIDERYVEEIIKILTKFGIHVEIGSVPN